jgi:hypothetical protein
MVNDVPLLKFMVLASLVGFVAFCASYTVLVWKKRHQSSAGATTARSRLRRWSVTGIVLGSLGLLITLVVREAVRAEGMLGGDGLYAIRATPDMRIVQLAEEGLVKEGEVVARFTSSEALADIQKAELNRDQLRNEKEILPSRPLPLDPELVRQHNLAEAAWNQLNSDLTFKRSSRETAGRDNMPPIIQQRDNLANINRDWKLAEGDLQQTRVKLEVARKQLDREQKLANRQNVSSNDLNDRQKEVGALEVDIIKFEAQLAATQERRRVCMESLAKLEQKAAAQDARLEADERDAKAKLVAAEIAKTDAVRKLADDAKEALKRRNWEMEDQDIKIKLAEVQIEAKLNKLEVKAPYEGEVVYRHASPGAAFNNGPVLVMKPKDGGLRFHFRLPDNQVKALSAANTITIELEETANNIEQRFPSKFLQATALARDPGMSLVELDCQAPPETVAALADGKPIKARFSWRPPLLNLWPFPTSLILFGLGVFGLVIANLAGWRPSWPKVKTPVPPDDEDALVSFAKAPTPKEGDTEEAVADTIPLRPELPGVPRERPVQPWEHPVGIRLREAIIREDITAELLDAVETAVEHQKDAVIVPMREALHRAPMVPDHARRLLDRLNNFETNDELKLIEKRCLAQRLTFLLYTLNMEIPGRDQRTAPVVVKRVEDSVVRS